MRKKMVAGNWKMYGSRASVNDLIQTILKDLPEQNKTEVVVFPPYIFLQQVQNLLEESLIEWGGQNAAAELEGPYTGEISAKMLLDFGCRYVLLGHSERRHIFGETNDIILKKFILAGGIGLVPILCVGETMEQRSSGLTETVIQQQLEPILQSEAAFKVLQNAIIAYEPVWAIGTGVTASPKQAQEIHENIRQNIVKYDKYLAQNLRILYGGSVKRSNAADLFAMPDIDGGLIGGASLDALEFLDIIKLCNSC